MAVAVAEALDAVGGALMLPPGVMAVAPVVSADTDDADAVLLLVGDNSRIEVGMAAAVVVRYVVAPCKVLLLLLLLAAAAWAASGYTT